ncbi:hypothetical protein AAG906_008995 [Vitis piasezkii]
MSESTLYIKVINDELIVVSLYVDDLLVTRSNAELVKQFKAHLMQAFEMTDLGEMTFLLGLEIQQLQQGTFIGQQKYAKEVLKKFNMKDCKSLCTLWLKMRNLVKMMVLKRYMHCVSELHYKAAKRVLRYFEKKDKLVLDGFAYID